MNAKFYLNNFSNDSLSKRVSNRSENVKLRNSLTIAHNFKSSTYSTLILL